MHRLVSIFLVLISLSSICAQTYDLSKYSQSELFPNHELITISTSKGFWRLGLAAPPKGSLFPSNNLMAMDVLPPNSIDPWNGKLKDRFSMAPGLDCLIYHDLESQGLPDFCSMTYHLIIEKGFNVDPEVHYFELKLPDEVAEEMLKILLGDTKWKCKEKHEPWYKLVKSAELKGQNY